MYCLIHGQYVNSNYVSMIGAGYMCIRAYHSIIGPHDQANSVYLATIVISVVTILTSAAAYAATPLRVAHSIDVTDDQIILVELRDSYTDSNLFDLENTTISFVPNVEGGYSVHRKELQWNTEIGSEIEVSMLSSSPRVLAGRHTIANFSFPFSGSSFQDILVSPGGFISFDSEKYSNIIQRMDTGEFRYDSGIKELSASFFEDTIAPLFWTYGHTNVSGTIHILEETDYLILTFSVSEPCCQLDAFTTENNVNEYQVKLYSSGQIDFSYQEIDSGMGIVGVFPMHKFGQGDLVGSFDFGESSELLPEYDVKNVSIYKTKDNRNLEFIYTFAGDLSAIGTPELSSWSLSTQVRLGSHTLWSSFISHNHAPNLRVYTYFESVSEPIIRGNKVFVTLNLMRVRPGNLVEIVNRVRGGEKEKRIDFSFIYPELLFRDSRSRNIDFSVEEIGDHQSRIYEGFHHQVDINTDSLMCDIIAELGDNFVLGAHYSSFRLDNGAASSPVSSFDSPSKGIGIGVGFSADPRDGPTSVSFCKTYNLQSNLAKVIPIGSVAGSSFGKIPYYFSSGLLTHEVGHNWIVSGISADVDGEPIWLSWVGGHWSNELHSPVPINLSGQVESSTMGGVSWQDKGGGIFSRVKSSVLASGFSYLDLYLMGLIPPENVPDLYILKNSEFIDHQDGEALYTGEKVDVSIENIIEAHGPRFPTYLESPKDFNMAFTYVRQYGESIDQEKLGILRDLRNTFFDHWCNVTGGLSTIYSEVTSKYQSPNRCVLSTDLGIGTEDPTYGVDYVWPDLDITDFATVDRGYLRIRDWDLSAGDTFTAWIDLEGRGTVDIYVRFVLPDKSWITLGSGGVLSQPSEIIPFLQSYELEGGGLQRIELMNVTLGTGADYEALQKGDYLLLIDIAHEGQTNPFHATRRVTGRAHRFRVN